MSKNSNMENVTKLYEGIKACFDAEGYSLEEIMAIKPEERGDCVDYEAVDSRFDGLMSSDSFIRKMNSCGMLQRYSLLYFSKRIAENYLKDSHVEICDIGLTKEEQALEVICSYAQRRGFVKSPSHYVDRGQALEIMTLRRLDCYTDALQEKLKSDAGRIEIPTIRSEEFKGINDRVANLRSLSKSYSGKHQNYVGRCVQ